MRGKLYAVGGKVEHVYQTKEMLCYNPADDSWISLPKMFKSRYDPGMTKKFYIVPVLLQNF